MQGKTINGFTLQRLLGVGGMAEVWYAENEIHKSAAVKILNKDLSLNEQIVRRFRTEAEIMVKLEHPNIRQVFGYGSIDGRPVIIMEYLEGNDLKARLKQGQRFTQDEFVKWWNQMVDALNYTHVEGIVHRDIKPSNIFIDKRGNVKLLDFGIAKIRESISMTQTGSMMGTLMYMSPEQVRDSKHIGIESDVYSLAVTFVHLLTGKRPYDSDNSSDYDIRKGIVEIPLDLAGVPEEWRGFLEPYLEKDPAKRPALRPFDGTKKEAPTLINIDDTLETARVGISSDGGKSRKGLWIGVAAVVVIALAVAFLLKPKEALPPPMPPDPDTEAFQACQTVNDYRVYLREFGLRARHYFDAKHFVDSVVADSTKRAEELLAQKLAREKAEAEAKAKLEAQKKGSFSISSSQKVYFAEGNLQYNPSANKWRFAPNPWDYLGDANSNISPNYNGWIDLFGWGTGNDPTKSIIGNNFYSSFSDWGLKYGRGWHTLNHVEWDYVFHQRSTPSGIRYAKAKVSGVNGVILLPDNWSSSTYSLSNTNQSGASFSSNSINASTWRSSFAPVGAVFLPAAGYRRGTVLCVVNSCGFYWLSLPYESSYARDLSFDDFGINVDNYNYRDIGFSVRLARPAGN